MSGRAKKTKKAAGGGISIARQRASAEVRAAMRRADLARAEAVLSRWTFGIDPARSVVKRPHIDAFREELGLLMADAEMDAGMAVKVERVMDLLFKAVVRDVGKTGGGGVPGVVMFSKPADYDAAKDVAEAALPFLGAPEGEPLTTRLVGPEAVAFENMLAALKRYPAFRVAPPSPPNDRVAGGGRLIEVQFFTDRGPRVFRAKRELDEPKSNEAAPAAGTT